MISVFILPCEQNNNKNRIFFIIFLKTDKNDPENILTMNNKARLVFKACANHDI